MDLTDKFYVDGESQSVEWVYYNPDSGAGGQYVRNIFDCGLIKEAADAEDFFDHIGGVCKQYLIDAGSEDFEAFDNDFRNAPCSFSGCGDETKDALIALAEALDYNADGFDMDDDEFEDEM